MGVLLPAATPASGNSTDPLKFCGAVLVTMALVPDVNLLRITGPNAGVTQETIRSFFRLLLGKSLSFAQRHPALTLDLRAGAAAAC